MSHRAPPPDLNGVLLGGRYRVVRALERGGMGSVYEARDERIGRAVAVKVMLPELASDPTLLERFRREALATAGLAHANVVQVSDYGADPTGHAFLVMELIVGRSLASILTESGALPVSRAVSLARQVCAALEAAHAAGIVHRDLKPGNVLVVPLADGRELVKVVDFGVAQLKRSAAYGRLTATGAILGTPAFMPPEQARGEDVDARADVYAVGAMLYGCLAGRKPFDGADPGTVIRQLLTEAPIPLSSVRREVGPALSSVVATAMAKDRAARFASARALSDALASALVEDGHGAAHEPARDAAATSDPSMPSAYALPGSVTASPGTRVLPALASPPGRDVAREPAPAHVEAPRRRSLLAWVALGVAAVLLALLVVVGTVFTLKFATARADRSPAHAATIVAPPPPAVVAAGSSVVLPPKPRVADGAADAAAALALEPTPEPPTEHHRAHHARGDAGASNDGWESSGWLTNPNGPR